MKIFLITNDTSCLTLSKLNIKLNDFTVTATRIEKHQEDLWPEIVNCVKLSIKHNYSKIAICTDPIVLSKISHNTFLEDFSNLALTHNAKILLFNAKTAKTIIPINNQLFWVDYFTGCDFLILYKTVFQNVISEVPENHQDTEKTLSELTSNKLLIFPMLSTDNSYASISLKNRMARMIKKIFKQDQLL